MLLVTKYNGLKISQAEKILINRKVYKEKLKSNELYINMIKT